MLNRIAIVFRKEVLDQVLRNRRSVGSTLFFTMLGPLLMLGIISVTSRVSTEQAEKPLPLPVAGREHAPGLMAFLKQQRVEVLPAPADPLQAVRAGEHDVVLVIPARYPAEFSAGRPATVELILDESRESAAVSIRRARRLLAAYSEQIGALRLLARGVSPGVAAAVAVAEVDVSTPQSRAAILFGIMPYFVVFSVFMAGAGIAIDNTVGERERGSLEALLTNPIARGELVLGKMAVALLLTLASVLFTLVAFAVLLSFAPLEDLGLTVTLNPLALAGIYLLVLPMMLLAVALQTIIATFTRNHTEAQTYLSFLALIPALPGAFLGFIPLKPALWTMLIPTFGQQLLINQLVRGEAVSGLNVLVCSAVTLAAGLTLTYAATRLFEREDVLFVRN